MQARHHLFAGGLRFSQLLMAGGLLIGGCSSAGKPPPPLPVQPAASAVTHHFGAPLATPTLTSTTRPIDSDAIAQDALDVTVGWTALERMPAGLSPLTPTARLIALPSSTQPIASSAAHLANARMVQPGAIEPFLYDLDHGRAGRTAPIATAHGALPPNVTAGFDLTSPGDPSRHIGVAVYRPEGAPPRIELGLLLNNPPHVQRVLLDPIDASRPSRLALVVPSSFAGTRGGAVLALIDVSPAGGPAHDAAVAQCVADLRSNLAAAASAPGGVIDVGDWPGLSASLQTLAAGSDDARGALVFLSGQTNASLCGDVALVADPPTIAAIAKRVADKTGVPPPQPIPRATLGWTLDSACFEELAALQAAEKLPPELDAVLTAYAGEPGRHPGALDDVVKKLTSREQLDARLTAENLVYLEDASPASRVRAYDWLAARNQAPAGYDPLGPNRERREALERAMPAAVSVTPAATTAPASAPSSSPPSNPQPIQTSATSASAAAGGVK